MKTKSDELRETIEKAIIESQTQPRVIELPWTAEAQRALEMLADEVVVDNFLGFTSYHGTSDGRPWEISIASKMHIGGCPCGHPVTSSDTEDLPVPLCDECWEETQAEVRRYDEYAAWGTDAAAKRWGTAQPTGIHPHPCPNGASIEVHGGHDDVGPRFAWRSAVGPVPLDADNSISGSYCDEHPDLTDED